ETGTTNPQLTFTLGHNLQGKFSFGNRKDVNFTQMEKVLPGSNRVLNNPVFAVAADEPGPPVVNVHDGISRQLRASFLAYDQAFQGGVRVAVGDVDGDNQPDIVTAPGPGGGTDIRVFDPTGQLRREFTALQHGFTGGAFVTVGEFTRDDQG